MPSQALVSETLTAVANALTTNFVPNFLGYSHISREDAIANHIPAFTSSVLETRPDELIGILDGTYLYIDSPKDYVLQRKTYSGHKKRNLIKTMMVSLISKRWKDHMNAFTFIHFTFFS